MSGCSQTSRLKPKTNPAFGRHANLVINGLADGTIHPGGLSLLWGFFCFFSCFKSSILADSEAATTQKPTSISACEYKHANFNICTTAHTSKTVIIQPQHIGCSLQQVTVTKKYNSRCDNVGLTFKKKKKTLLDKAVQILSSFTL